MNLKRERKMTVISLIDKLDTGLQLGMVKQLVTAITDLRKEVKDLKAKVQKLEDMDNETLRNDLNKVVKEIKEDNANNTL
jgi:FtsZ-binding cell division protein ZapB